MAYKKIMLNSNGTRWVEIDNDNNKRIVRIEYDGKLHNRKILFCENVQSGSGAITQYFTVSFLGSKITLKDEGDIVYDVTHITA